MVSRAEFERYVEEAFLEIPERLRRRIENVVFVVDTHARAIQRGERGIRRQGTLLGLYEGIPYTRRAGGGYQWVLPDRITLFMDSIARFAGPEPGAVQQMVRSTVHHEVAHYFGFSEAAVRRWERTRPSRTGRS